MSMLCCVQKQRKCILTSSTGHQIKSSLIKLILWNRLTHHSAENIMIISPVHTHILYLQINITKQYKLIHSIITFNCMFTTLNFRNCHKNIYSLHCNRPGKSSLFYVAWKPDFNNHSLQIIIKHVVAITCN